MKKEKRILSEITFEKGILTIGTSERGKGDKCPECSSKNVVKDKKGNIIRCMDCLNREIGEFCPPL